VELEAKPIEIGQMIAPIVAGGVFTLGNRLVSAEKKTDNELQP